jgi:hypothetical protein
MLGYMLGTGSEHFCYMGSADLRIKHRVIQVVLRPIQLEVFLHKSGAIPVNCVNLRYCSFLRCSRCDQSEDLSRAGRIEERPKYILAVAKKILRTPANDYAWTSWS